MIDLHCHILPGVDDGANDWTEATEMCRMAAEDGCTALVATPHQRRAWPTGDPPRLRALCDELMERQAEQLTIHLGGEVHVDSGLLDELEQSDLGGVCPMAGSDWLLIEFGQLPPAQGAEATVHELRMAGWRPIVAHPEFIPFLAEDSGLLGHLVRAGARAQITAMSVTGAFGRRVQEVVLHMIDSHLIHFVASDSHSPDWRPPGLAAARRMIARRWSDELANRLTAENPKAVIENRQVAMDPLASE